jgi:hypothetical protein
MTKHMKLPRHRETFPSAFCAWSTLWSVNLLAILSAGLFVGLTSETQEREVQSGLPPPALLSNAPAVSK